MITIEEIDNIATLSKLFVDEQELNTLASDMQKIIDFADTINNATDIDTDFDLVSDKENAFRQDDVCESFCKDDILKNASDTDKDHFLVRKRA